MFNGAETHRGSVATADDPTLHVLIQVERARSCPVRVPGPKHTTSYDSPVIYAVSGQLNQLISEMIYARGWLIAI